MTHTRKMAIIAILSAISFLLMFFDFPILPGASFLKLDFSILPILLGLVVLNLRGALSILLVRSVLKLLLNNQGVNTYIGLPMNIIAVAVFVIAFALIWKKEQTIVRFLIASVVGTLGLTVAMLLLNYIYAIPLYATFANFDISKILGVANYLFAMVIPLSSLPVLTALSIGNCGNCCAEAISPARSSMVIDTILFIFFKCSSERSTKSRYFKKFRGLM